MVDGDHLDMFDEGAEATGWRAVFQPLRGRRILTDLALRDWI